MQPTEPTSQPIAMPTEANASPSAGEPAPPPGGLLFRYRSSLPVALALILVLCPWRLEMSAWQLWIGGALVLAGVVLRLWCILQIGGSARKTSKLKAERVISWGPYSLVRNPIYIANSTTFAGFTVAAGLAWLLPLILIGLFAWYNAIVGREERFLEESHPDAFRAYKLQARRWIPSVRYRGRPADVAPYPFLRALKRERGHIIAVGAGVLAVLVLRVLVPSIWGSH